MGPTRAPEFHEAFCRAYEEILELINSDTKDLEYSFDTIDKRLARIFGEHFAPAEVRYGPRRKG